MRVTDRIWWLIIIGCLILALALTARAAATRTPANQQQWQYRWQTWLPDKWVRIARCETGIDWTHHTRDYQGAFGFHRDSYDAFRLDGYPSEAYLATPWQQYMVALAIYRRYGLSGWGCRNA